MKDSDGVSFGLVQHAFRDLHRRDPVDGDEVPAWLNEVGLHRILAWHGADWKAMKDKPQGLAPLPMRNPSTRRTQMTEVAAFATSSQILAMPGFAETGH